ncbi:glycosyltransferase [Pseudomonadales bacterium]|nr:glycosyltransferase [Pseudomonadales bacterium]
MKTILATAYDINPYKGSESGTGWNFILQISRFNKVIAVTRLNNRGNIEKFIKENAIDVTNISFHYYDLPYLLRFWKRGSRGSFLYYNLWQVGLVFDVFAKNLKFDFVQHINFHADHVPSFLWVFRKPFIWGPINHNEPIPKQFTSTKSVFVKDRLTFVIKYLRWYCDPFIYLCSKSATAVIGSNSSVQSRLRISDERFHKISTVGTSAPELQADSVSRDIRSSTADPFTIISVGRFVPIKSFDISIRAFNDFYCSLTKNERVEVRLMLVGDGPLRKELKNIVNSLECCDAVEFIKWIEQQALFDLYKSSAVMLAPSHEGAGAVIAEAQSYGLPVICFDNFGAGELIDKQSGIVVKQSGYVESYTAMGSAMKKLYRDNDQYSRLRKGSFKNFEENLSWDSKGEKLNIIYKSITS